MKSRMKCRCLVLMLLLVAVSALANEPRAKRITVLKPAEDAEVLGDVFVIELENGGRTLAMEPGKGFKAEQAFDWTVDLERGTYTTKIAKPNAADLALRERLRDDGNTGGRRFRAASQCSEYDTGDDWIPCDDEERAQGWRYILAHETRYQHPIQGPLSASRTEAELHWKACNGTLQSDFFGKSCLGFSPWFQNLCVSYEPGSGSTLDAEVLANYVNTSLWDPSRETGITERVRFQAHLGGATPQVHASVMYGEVGGWFTGHTFITEGQYQAYCSGTGGGGANTSSGGLVTYSERYCVPVYEGQTGLYLGDCCGYHNHEIINCAKGYLN